MKPNRARRTARQVLPPLLALASLSACSGSPAVTYHTLGISRPDVRGGTISCTLSVGVGPVALPDLLSRRGVVTRTDDFTVEVSQTHEWGGRLQDEVSRALTANLRLRLPGADVRALPWEAAQTPQVQVVVALERFDGAPGGRADLRGTWVVQDPRDGRALARGAVALHRFVGGGPRALVQAQSLLLADLSDRLVAGLAVVCGG